MKKATSLIACLVAIGPQFASAEMLGMDARDLVAELCPSIYGKVEANLDNPDKTAFWNETAAPDFGSSNNGSVSDRAASGAVALNSLAVRDALDDLRRGYGSSDYLRSALSDTADLVSCLKARASQIDLMSVIILSMWESCGYVELSHRLAESAVPSDGVEGSAFAERLISETMRSDDMCAVVFQ